MSSVDNKEEAFAKGDIWFYFFLFLVRLHYGYEILDWMKIMHRMRITLIVSLLTL
jgi:hypothetical protein